MKKIAVILSGCGVFDGAEIHETTMLMLAIKNNKADYELFAPDIEQQHVINHLTGEEMKEKRNVLIEAARIGRGKVKSTKELNMANFDALMFPGGFGVAKNLCDLAFKGENMTVLPEIETIIKETHKQNKPIGALCIAPVMISKVIKNAEITIGSDANTIDVINKIGGQHQQAGKTDVVIDQQNKIVTTPCYMLDASISEIAEGANNAVKELLKLM